MARPFSETTRSLNADGYRASFLALGLVALLGLAWAFWLVEGQVATWAVTQQASLEVSGRALGLDLDQAGIIAHSYLAVGKRFKLGDPLLELDSRDLALVKDDVEAKGHNLQAQLEASERQGRETVASLERAIGEAEASIAQARAEWTSASTQARLQEDRASRYQQLYETHLISEVDHLKVQLELASAHGEVSSASSALELAQTRQRSAVQQLALARAKLAESLTLLQGDLTNNQAELKKIELDLSKRILRAPMAGSLGEIAQLQEGSYVEEGFRLGTLVPDGELRVLAKFEPAESLGRIRPGQMARVRLTGFPWTQYGFLQARVLEVGSEPRSGLIEVGLALEGGPSEIPLQHGLPGNVEVRVGSCSPLALLLRSVGLRLQATTGATP